MQNLKALRIKLSVCSSCVCDNAGIIKRLENEQ